MLLLEDHVDVLLADQRPREDLLPSDDPRAVRGVDRASGDAVDDGQRNLLGVAERPALDDESSRVQLADDREGVLVELRHARRLVPGGLLLREGVQLAVRAVAPVERHLALLGVDPVEDVQAVVRRGSRDPVRLRLVDGALGMGARRGDEAAGKLPTLGLAAGLSGHEIQPALSGKGRAFSAGTRRYGTQLSRRFKRDNRAHRYSCTATLSALPANVLPNQLTPCLDELQLKFQLRMIGRSEL